MELNKMSETMCYRLHSLFNSLPRYTIDNIDDIPFKNGIYIFFQKGERYYHFDRIVRVGTDTGENQLISRMRQHFLNENKDRSIFRKNIGRAFLMKDDDSLIDYWNIDLTSRKNKAIYYDIDKTNRCKLLEKQISEFMKANFSFVVFSLNNKDDRLRFEEAIISTLFNSNDFIASSDWLGNYVPATKGNHVKESRMWLSQGIHAKPVTEEELALLFQICRGKQE